MNEGGKEVGEKERKMREGDTEVEARAGKEEGKAWDEY